ncbi:hypothetical protein BH23GEM7_BH23GEM7_20060 [soil metagenome]
MLCTFVSPFRADRERVRALLLEGRFFEIHVDCDLSVCMRRDAKGLYQKALQGEIPSFTGISSPYEAPERPEMRVETDVYTPSEIVEQVLARLRHEGIVRSA